MTQQEKRELATRLAEGSRVLDFESALRIVDLQPSEAERLIRYREECARRQQKRSRIFRELREAVQEFASR
jgi:hypothetical protein